MPRCCNENKSLRLMNSNQQNSTLDSVLIGTEAPVVVEKSHRRIRCDLSPVPTNNANYIKLIGIKVKTIVYKDE